MDWPVSDAVPVLYVLADQWYRERVALRTAGVKQTDPVGDSITQVTMRAVRRTRPGAVSASDRLGQVRALGGDVG